jgi:lysophospholipase L1-like esterase
MGSYLSGLMALPIILGTHTPIDVLVIMLGTNDLKARFAVGPGEIAASIERMVRTVSAICLAQDWPNPDVLIVAPPPILERGLFAETFKGGAAKSHQLSPLYLDAARRVGAGFLDAGAHVQSSEWDGIHLDADQHRLLATAIGDALTGKSRV